MELQESVIEEDISAKVSLQKLKVFWCSHQQRLQPTQSLTHFLAQLLAGRLRNGPLDDLHDQLANHCLSICSYLLPQIRQHPCEGGKSISHVCRSRTTHSAVEPIKSQQQLTDLLLLCELQVIEESISAYHHGLSAFDHATTNCLIFKLLNEVVLSNQRQQGVFDQRCLDNLIQVLLFGVGRVVEQHLPARFEVFLLALPLYLNHEPMPTSIQVPHPTSNYMPIQRPYLTIHNPSPFIPIPHLSPIYPSKPSQIPPLFICEAFLQCVEIRHAPLSIIQIIRMKQDPINVDEGNQAQEVKRTRKLKAPPIQPTNRSTRRAHRKHSADQCPLPEVIPLSDGQDIILFQSYERELTRLVLQLPLPLLTASIATSTAATRVQATPIDIEVQTEGGNVVCKLRPGAEVDEEAVLVIHGRYSWLAQGQVISKIIKSTRRVMQMSEWSEVVRFRPEGARSDGFVVLILRWEERLTRLYRGLVNQGNTCYMNSYLQMLFHIVQFRKLLFASQVKQKDRFPATLQLLFYRMLSQQKPVSPQQLVRSFGWSKKQVQVQHDAQQFSCLFFDALERTVIPIIGSSRWSSVPQLFCGQLVHYIQCCNVGTTEFRTQNRERFYDLQLPIAPTLAHSLHDYVGQQKLQADNAYRTELFGLQDAHKGLTISFLPPVLMLQLKRFQFNPYTQANQKVLDRFAYPQSIDFAPWTQEPSVSKPYQLYAVLVHEGSQASSGHYYVFIKMEGQWFRFNDERVEQVDRAHALDYNYGGSAQVVEYDSKQMKVVQKQVQNKATAYMLVYLSKQYSQELTEDDNRLPEWLVQHTKMKLSLDQQKKLRKQSICDIPLLRWRDFEGKQCLGSGLTVSGDEGTQEEKIEMVPKSQKMEEWLEQLQKNGKKEETLYLLWNAMEKEAILNIRTRSCTTVSQLFKDITDPTIFFAPIQAQKDQFLVIIKAYDSTATPKFYFSNCLTIKKDSRKEDLLLLLHAHSPVESNATYYIEDKKSGLIKLAFGDTELLPAASPSRNQLLIAIVQYSSQGEVRKLYDEQLDTVTVIFRCQVTKQSFQMELSKRLTVQELRELLFAEIQKDNEGLKSPQNIVLKYKGKRNGKQTIQAKDDELLSELVKVDKVVLFGLSAFSASERNHLKEVTLLCRDDYLRLSEPIKIVIQREKQDKLLELAEKNERVQALLPKTEGLHLRSFLLGRDRSYITDIVDEHGRVPSKGELGAVLQRDRNSVLVLEQTEENILKPQQRMMVLLHHVTKTGERFGPPRIFILPRDTTLLSTRDYLLQQIQMETYEFEGKNYNFNPFKLRLVAYLKDVSKGIELTEEVMEPEHTEGEEVKAKNGVVDTLDGKFPKSKFVRVAVTHNYIAKGSQVLKLNVQ